MKSGLTLLSPPLFSIPPRSTYEDQCRPSLNLYAPPTVASLSPSARCSSIFSLPELWRSDLRLGQAWQGTPPPPPPLPPKERLESYGEALPACSEPTNASPRAGRVESLPFRAGHTRVHLRRRETLCRGGFRMRLADEEYPELIEPAQLWMGTHPSCPSRLAATNQSLKEYLVKNPSLLGSKVVAKFGADLPFLFKVCLHRGRRRETGTQLTRALQ